MHFFKTVLELLKNDLSIDVADDVVKYLEQVPLFELEGQKKFELIIAHLLYYGITVCNTRVESKLITFYRYVKSFQK